MSISSDEFFVSTPPPAAKKSRNAKRPDPIALAAESMVRVLEQQRESSPRWLSAAELVGQIPELTLETATAALKKAPAKGRIVVALPGHPNSLWLLKEDLEPLSQDSGFLKSLVTATATAESPIPLLTDVTRPLEKTLKKLVDGYWPLHAEQLPTGLAAKSVRSGKKSLFAIHDERFPLPEVELSQQLIKALSAQKEAGDEHYPTRWVALLQAAGNSTSDDLIRRATATHPFARQARLLPIDGETWVAFTDDVPAIIHSDTFLERLVQQTCSATAPEIKLSAVAKKLPKDLQQPFVDHWLTSLEADRAPSFASLLPAGTAKKRDVLIRDRRFPPPELALAESLVSILQRQKEIGNGSYPTTWQRLLALTGATSTAIRDKAISTDIFQSRVICSLAGESDAPLALVGDEDQLAGSPELLVTLIKKLRTDDNQLVPIDKLTKVKGIHPRLKTILPEMLEQKILRKSLPAGVGSLRVAKKSSLFLLSDLIGITSVSTVPRETAAVSSPSGSAGATSTQNAEQFAHDFDQAFAKLDGKLGLPNYASLVDLRPLLSQYPREIFDRELLKLRRSGQYALSLVEGRFGLSDEERAACLVVDHVPHLLVQKKK